MSDGPGPGDDMQQTWTDRGRGWVEQERTFDAVFAPVTEAILGDAAPAPGQRVLDVGCGSGTLLDAVAAAGADPVGVDISPTMVEAARRRVPAAAVLQADAQSADLRALAPGRPFDRVLSRFGVMFFADPRAAFANLSAATAIGGRLTFACWRTLAENPTFTAGTDPLTVRLSAPPAQPDTAPGPRSLADPARIREVLATGWSDVDIAPLDFICDYTTDGSDGVEARLAGILATSVGHRALVELAPTLTPATWTALLDEVRHDLSTAFGDGVRFPGACWLVTASRG